MNYQVSSHIRQLQDRIKLLEKELVEYKLLHISAISHANSLEDMVITLTENNAQYMAWFNNHKYLVTPRPEPITGPETLYHPVEPS